MYNSFRKNIDKFKYFIVSGFILIFLLLLTIVNKSDKKITTLSPNSKSFDISKDSITLKKFLLNKINSPFINIEYKIEKGDTIQKILQKYEVENNQIQKVILNYKKFANSNQLLIGNKVNIIIEKNLTKNTNSILKFSLPITKSTLIEISKDENDHIVSKKIITKLYKKKILAQNIIKNNLYSSAVDAKINPDTIIEFARIFGFEIDFQRDIRKNDYFKILYEKFFDENGEYVKSGSVLYAYMSINGREISLYKFGNNEVFGYFDANGKSVEKALMKTPINGARLSSSFGNRKHPILVTLNYMQALILLLLLAHQ